jgi:SAM-dependent methyltransferase
METNPRFWEVFFDVFEHLPRQGPGSRACTARALALCRGLPARPVIADFGCGVGAQTLDLASLTDGTIDAFDTHAPFVARLRDAVEARGLGARVHPHVGDMARPPFEPASVDLIWSEGAAYFLGIENALRTWRPLLRPGGFLAFTEAVWLRSDPPEEVRAMWAAEYPQIADAAANLAFAARCEYEIAGHFTLPNETWWDDFYTPMENRIRALRTKYAGDAAASGALDQIEREIDLHRRFGDCYGYEFFILRRPGP